MALAVGAPSKICASLREKAEALNDLSRLHRERTACTIKGSFKVEMQSVNFQGCVENKQIELIDHAGMCTVTLMNMTISSDLESRVVAAFPNPRNKFLPVRPFLRMNRLSCSLVPCV
jgi:hypothetical protein